jgi:flagellar protein FlaJ
MSFFEDLAFRLFGQASEFVSQYFTDIRSELKQSRLRYSLQEFISISMLTSFLIFIFLLPVLSFLLAFVLQSFLFSFIFAITLSTIAAVSSFFLILNYPKTIRQARAKDVDGALPFATLYLSTITSSKLPLHKTIEIFSKFATSGEMGNQVNEMIQDMKVFGMDVNTALERAINRSPSKAFKELLYGILSTVKAGGDLTTFLREKSKNFLAEYRRRIYEFSHNLTVYIEVYLTVMVLGAIFFTILTAIISGIAGTGADSIIMLQFLLIFILLPTTSLVFIYLIRSATPRGE